MDVGRLIATARAKGQAALNEHESKLALAAHGVPVSAEGLAQSADQAEELARELGFPVALKACAATLMHKSEGGWVRLGLADETAVRAAYDDIAGRAARAGLALDGVLVQEMVGGNRELVLGLSRDPQFGPCVMLGLGGVLAEALADTVFRMAPLERLEVLDMLEQLRCRPMLAAFRGQSPADLEALCAAVIGLGRLGLEHDAVVEVDVNPLIITAQGRVKAVDGLVVLARS